MELRCVIRNGQKVLQAQQQGTILANGEIIENWRDIPIVEEPKEKSIKIKKPRMIRIMRNGDFNPATYDVGQEVKIHIKGPFVDLVFDTKDSDCFTIFFGPEPE